MGPSFLKHRFKSGWRYYNKVMETCMKKKEEFVKETEEQKRNRWDKQQKMAKGLAKSCGIDLKKLERERAKMRQEKMDLIASKGHY